MNRIITAVALVLIFGLGFAFTNAYAGDRMSQGWYRAYETKNLIGTPVENPLGEMVGSIQNFVVDPSGHVDFVIVKHTFYWEYVPRPSQTVAVPFKDIIVRPSEKISILKFSAWKLDFAPKLETNEIGLRHWADRDYSYFGLRPYWTESAHKKIMNPYRWGGEAQDF
jgi:sporulation protein YlmC with PRC-barrel domain